MDGRCCLRSAGGWGAGGWGVAGRLSRLLFAAGALALAVGWAQAEDAVVISSSMPAQVPGLIVTDTQTLNLPAGGSIALLLRSGQMVRIRGPFDGTLAAATPTGATSGAAGLIEALRGQGVDASVIGAGRGASPVAQRAMDDHGVAVDPEHSAIYCVGPNETVWLNRPKAFNGSLRLRRAQSVREVSWPNGATKIEWPGDLIIEDGDRFETLSDRGAPVTTMIFRRLGDVATPAAWIAEHLLLGCRQQAEPALRELARAVDEAGDRPR
ncbi:hypothetical protein GCM10011611_21390 [Aliidongia dinghuensis]|uniref:Uncharacterized protein n=1 Tax=Aliidongia dinghuensis TaxID=1867774 RepID=A0A8J2YST3_9PROT|nr:hypothetical protein [Aliidongia dinghuensis]GGF15329.1 hypothetical protein GCM10011611_21390 [Aliidongia dinghuensis]